MVRQSSPHSEISELQERIGHEFADPALLVRALTHSSLAFEQGSTAVDCFDNEQLEFLGDAVLGLIAADSLYRRYPELKEGELTRLRAALVSRQHLGEAAAKLELGEALLLGKGEERSGGRSKPALLANCLEAVIGAMYLDGGLEAARVFVEKWVVEPDVAELREALERGGGIGDHKSALQEYLQARKAGQPQYLVKGESGPDHRKRFLVEVRMGEAGTEARVLARGSGTTKKHAEQEAARRAYERLLRESEEAARGSAASGVAAGGLAAMDGNSPAEASLP
jgi:ribonuclease-3